MAIPKFNPAKAPEDVRLEGQRLQFALGLLNGLSQTQAAIEAGIEGDPRSASFRKNCSDRAHAKYIQRWLEWAQAEVRGEHAGETHEDLVKRLWGDVYSTNAVARDKACTQLIKLGELQPKKAAEVDRDPAEAMAELAGLLCPECTARFAGDVGFPISAVQDKEVSHRLQKAQEKLAKDWIRDNAREAYEFARFFAVGSSSPAKPNGAAA